MDLVEIKDGLYIGSAIDNVQQIIDAHIDVVIDLQGGFDKPELAWSIDSYLYCHLWDLWMFSTLPGSKVERIAKYGWECWDDGASVAVHCTAGHNRSALIVGLILHLSGMAGPDIVKLIQEKREGALSNPVFRKYLEELK